MLHKKFASLLFTILCITPSLSFAQDYRTGIRIAWDYATQTYLNGGSYGRLKLLADGRQALVYDAGGVPKIRFKRPGSSSFSSATTVASPPAGSGYTNCELLELSDGTLLYAYNERIDGMGLKIKIKYSFNGGLSWVDEQTLYEVRESDYIASEGLFGIWEPAMIELPSGEVQLYFASELGVPDHHQKIMMLRSLHADDSGRRQWEPASVDVCYTVGFRDGMPVPLVLQDGRGIVFAIEDDGFGGGFQPGIIYTSMADNWTSGVRYGDSPNRWVAVTQGEPRGGGAPYIIQLRTGETLVSTQTNALADQRGAPWDDMYKSRPFVYIGDAGARNFSRFSIPFPFMDEPDMGGVWNSLCQTDDSTVVCISDVHGHPTRSGIWSVEGHIMHPLTSYALPAGISLADIEWAPLMSDIFVGSQSQAQMRVASAWTADSLFLHFVVADRTLRSGSEGAPVWDTDGVEFYCDALNRSTDAVTNGAMKYLVNIDGGTLVSRMTSSGWTDIDAAAHQMRYVISRRAAGYVIDMALPWNSLLRLNPNHVFAGYFKLHNNDYHNGRECIHHEVLSGTDEGRSRTWWQIRLSDQLPTEVPALPVFRAQAGGKSSQTYNLSGLPADLSRPGIYVRGGRKVAVR